MTYVNTVDTEIIQEPLLEIDSIDQFQDATAGQQYVISWESLLTALHIDGDIFEGIALRVTSVNNGSLTCNGVGILAEPFILDKNKALIWTPQSSTIGLVDAFTIEVLNDGVSEIEIPVSVQVSNSNGLDVSAKYSTDVLDVLYNISALKEGAGADSDTLSGVMDSYIEINNIIGTDYTYYSSASFSDSSFFPVTLYYTDGSSATYNGTLNNLSSFLNGLLYSTTADVSKYVFTIPGVAKITAKGDLNYLVDADGGYSLISANFNNISVDILDPYVISDLGKFSSSIEGNVYLSSSDSLSGTIDRIVASADYFINSSIIEGDFSITGSTSSGSSVSGVLSSITDEYRDGSYLRVNSLSDDHFISSNDELNRFYFTDPTHLPNDDTISIDVPSLGEDLLISSGTGNDIITLKGGGGYLHVDSGDGHDVITTIDGNHNISLGLGNDIFVGGTGVDTIIFENHSSYYQLEWDPIFQALTVFSNDGDVDILSGFDVVRFSDGDTDSSSLMNVAPTLSVISPLSGATEDVYFSITWNDLSVASDASDYENNEISFLIESTIAGTLMKGESIVSDGVTTLSPGESLSWLPDADQNGIISAFSIRAVDSGMLQSSVAVDVPIVVANINDNPVGSVTLSGTARQNETLSAIPTIEDADIIPGFGELGAIQIRWLADGSLIDGATENTFTITQSEVGKVIVAEAYYTDLQGTTESVFSTATASVENVNDPPTSSNKVISATTLDPIELSIANFGYNDLDGDSLSSVKIEVLPIDGALEVFDGLQWKAVTVNQEITASEISDGLLRLTPYIYNDKVHSSMYYKVSDGAVYSTNANQLSVSEGYQVSCDIRYWNGVNNGIPNVNLSIGDTSSTSTNEGELVMGGVIDEYDHDDGLMAISPALSNSASGAHSSITLSDVLSSLKIYLGKDLNESIDSPYNHVAADFDGGGFISLTDVLLLLKFYLGKDTGTVTPEWVFLDASQNHNFSIENIPLPIIEHDFSVDETFNLVGVLRGDVDGSWTPDA